MPKTPGPEADESLVFSYLQLRRAIGIVGCGLPFVLALGRLVAGAGLEPSLSAYYYTPMRDVFVGALCSIGVFLLSYRGPARVDAVAGDLACVFAVGVALFPCVPPAAAADSEWARHVHWVHYGSAACLFLVLSYFSLALFRRSGDLANATPEKLRRNRVYTVCGITMLACIALMGVLLLLPESAPVFAFRPLLVLESVAVLSFGVSWLVKGEAILADRRPAGPAGSRAPKARDGRRKRGYGKA